MPDEGIISLAEAFASAESEVGLAEPTVTEPALPVGEADDASAATTQPAQGSDNPEEEQGTEETIDLDGFKELFTQESEETTVEPGSPEFLELPVTVDTVNGQETVSVGELVKGYLRQADYTRKTQDVAVQRRALNDAMEFYDTFRDNPQEFARTIAVRAGLLEEGAEPVKNIETAKIPTAETIEEMVEQRVQERLKDDPAIQEARLAQARNAVNNVFAGIEQDFSVRLDTDTREAVIREANQRGTTDLRLTFEAMLGRLRSQQSRRPAATARPTGAPVTAEQAAAEKTPLTVEEAFKLAEADLAGA